jgi:hypothetical protein
MSQSCQRRTHAPQQSLEGNVMAQEVAQANPEAVVQGADGYLRVAYGRLGWRLMPWEEWTALGAAHSAAKE